MAMSFAAFMEKGQEALRLLWESERGAGKEGREAGQPCLQSGRTDDLAMTGPNKRQKVMTIGKRVELQGQRGFERPEVMVVNVDGRPSTPTDYARLCQYTLRDTAPFQDWEVASERISRGEMLGRGAFGEVFRARMAPLQDAEQREEKVVAVKMLGQSATEKDLKELVCEMKVMMGMGKHPNIVNLIGCSGVAGGTIDAGLMLIIEFCANGNLRDFLRKNRAEEGVERRGSGACVTCGSYAQPKLRGLIHYALQVARGMEHLANRGVIHRDLAARNCLVTADKTVKIADFGLSRELNASDYYSMSPGGPVPWKWVAMEALSDQRYALESDVWSFGVLFWEILTMGADPYPFLHMFGIKGFLAAGHRLQAPDGCPAVVYDLMRECWAADPMERPKFSQIVERLVNILEAAGEKGEFGVPVQTSPRRTAEAAGSSAAPRPISELLETAQLGSGAESSVSQLFAEETAGNLAEYMRYSFGLLAATTHHGRPAQEMGAAAKPREECDLQSHGRHVADGTSLKQHSTCDQATEKAPAAHKIAVDTFQRHFVGWLSAAGRDLVRSSTWETLTAKLFSNDKSCEGFANWTFPSLQSGEFWLNSDQKTAAERHAAVLLSVRDGPLVDPSLAPFLPPCMIRKPDSEAATEEALYLFGGHFAHLYSRVHVLSSKTVKDPISIPDVYRRNKPPEILDYRCPSAFLQDHIGNRVLVGIVHEEGNYRNIALRVLPDGKGGHVITRMPDSNVAVQPPYRCLGDLLSCSALDQSLWSTLVAAPGPVVEAALFRINIRQRNRYVELLVGGLSGPNEPWRRFEVTVPDHIHLHNDSACIYNPADNKIYIVGGGFLLIAENTVYRLTVAINEVPHKSLYLEDAPTVAILLGELPICCVTGHYIAFWPF